MKKDRLFYVILALIRNGERAHRSLQHGLIMAYTPPGKAQASARMVLSRAGDKPPSVAEIDVVMARIRGALAEMNQAAELFEQSEPYTFNRRFTCVALEWQVMVQEVLL